MIETSSEEDAEEKMTSNHPASFGRSSISQIKVASNEAERLQLLADKAGVPLEPGPTPTTINNNLKSGHVKNINVINNHQNQTKQFNTPPAKPPKPHQVIDTNANLPKPEINPTEKVQIGEFPIKNEELQNIWTKMIRKCEIETKRQNILFAAFNVVRANN